MIFKIYFKDVTPVNTATDAEPCADLNKAKELCLAEVVFFIVYRKKNSIFCITIVNLFQRVAVLTLLTTKSYFQSTANYNDFCF